MDQVIEQTCGLGPSFNRENDVFRGVKIEVEEVEQIGTFLLLQYSLINETNIIVLVFCL